MNDEKVEIENKGENSSFFLPIPGKVLPITLNLLEYLVLGKFLRIMESIYLIWKVLEVAGKVFPNIFKFVKAFKVPGNVSLQKYPGKGKLLVLPLKSKFNESPMKGPGKVLL